jgi:hypothetical protein
MSKAPRRTREQWAALIRQMESSGLTQVSWCKRNNINYKSMLTAKNTIKNASPAATQVRSTASSGTKGFVLAKASPKLHAFDEASALEMRFGGLIVSIKVAR